MNGVNKLGSCRPDLLARPRRSGSTISELFEAWFGTAADGWSPSTVRQNCSVLNCHLHHHIGSVTVGNVTPALIDAFHADLPAAVPYARTASERAFSRAVDALRQDQIFVEFHPHIVVAAASYAGEHLRFASL